MKYISGIDFNEHIEDFHNGDSMRNLISNVQQWFLDKGLETQEPSIQMLKLLEELGELAEGMAKEKPELIEDALGDIQVVLIGLHLQLGYSPKQTLKVAYNEIKNRTGVIKNGNFVKEEDL